MARKPKIEPIKSANFAVCIEAMGYDGKTPTEILYSDVNIKNPHGWFVRERAKCAETKSSDNWEDYYALKRIWRRSKEDFESACRFMDYTDLFSREGVKLP